MSDQPWKASYKKLATHPDFRLLFEIGPLAEEIKRLERQLLDLNITDPGDVADIRNRLWGIHRVHEAVEIGAREPEPQPSPIARLRRAVGSRFLPRPLG